MQEICQRDCETWEKAEELEARLQEQLEDMYAMPNMWSELIGTALDRVNWHEIVEDNLE